MKTILLLLTFMIANINYAQDSVGTVVGTVWDEASDEPLIQAQVQIIQGQNVYRTLTDWEGRYRIDSIPVGIYEARSIYYRDTNYAEYCFQVYPGAISFVDITIDYSQLIVCDFGLFWYKTPELPELNRKQIKENVNRFQLPTLLSGMTSKIRLGKENELQFQGARTGDYLQLIDGVKTLNFIQVPSATMRYIAIYDGFIPAKYGDTNGGVIVIETLSYFDLLDNHFPEK